MEAYGPVTVLVNNAAATDVTISGVDNHVDEITSEDWDYTGTLLTVDGGATSHQPVLPRTMLS